MMLHPVPMRLAFVQVFLAAAAFAGGTGQFVPLGSKDGTTRANNVSRDTDGNPIVGGSFSDFGSPEADAAYFLIQALPPDAVRQNLPVPSGTPALREVLKIPRGAHIAVGRAQNSTQSTALIWDNGLESVARPLPPLGVLVHSDSEDGKYEDEVRGVDPLIIAVGVSFSADFATLLPTIWTSDNGFLPSQLDLLPGGAQNGAARALVRIDGVSVIAGTAVSSAGASEAVIWHDTQVQTVLPRTGLAAANAAAISQDGRFVAGLGVSSTTFTLVPALWCDPDGDGQYDVMTPALPAGTTHGRFNAVRLEPVERDAPIAVGTALNAMGQPVSALFYDPDNGLRPLADVLTGDFGVDLQGFTLTEANDLSTGGGKLRLCGNGRNAQGEPEGWYAEITPGGAPCPADIDGDGVVGLGDLSILLTNFGTLGGATPEMGDLNGDGSVDLADLSLLLEAFGTSCS